MRDVADQPITLSDLGPDTGLSSWVNPSCRRRSKTEHFRRRPQGETIGACAQQDQKFQMVVPTTFLKNSARVAWLSSTGPSTRRAGQR